MMANHLKPTRSPLYWIAVLYFAQGYPFGIFFDVLPVFMRQHQVDLQSIGYLSLIGLAWTVKFLWSPIVDKLGRPQQWMAAMSLCFGAICMVFFALEPLHAFNSNATIATINSPEAAQNAVIASMGMVLFLVTLMAIFSATNDVAIDGYSIRFLAGQNIGKANGIRVAAYRVGLLMSGGLLMMKRFVEWPALFLLAGLLAVVLGFICFFAPALMDDKPISPHLKNQPKTPFSIEQKSWMSLAFLAMVIFVLWQVDKRLKILTPWVIQHFYNQDLAHHLWPLIWSMFGVVAFLFKLFFLWRAHRHNHRDSSPLTQSSITRLEENKEGGLLALLARPAMVQVLIFILLFKLADAAMGFMVKPFWVDRNFSAEEIGFVSVNIGIGLTILGSLVGGWFTDRWGVYKSLWVMGLFQMASNGVYALAAWYIPTGVEPILEYRLMIYSASAFESFTGGLGTAAFLALLMSLVNPKFAATEYAALSAAFAASRSIAGFLSGFGAQEWGYAAYFALTMVLGFPAYALLPWVKQALLLQKFQPHPLDKKK